MPSKEKQELVSIEDDIKRELSTINQRVSAPASNKISTAGKKFTLPTGESSEGPMHVVVLDFAWSLVHYPGAYKQGEYQDPDCWAVGREKPESGLLRPHEDVPEPRAETCKVCPMNAWGSDGRGKACKNQIRLTLVKVDAEIDADPMTLYVSPKGLKNWNAYVNNLASSEETVPFAVVTEIGFDPSHPYPLLTFKMADVHARKHVMHALKAKSEPMLLRGIELRG